MNILVHDRKDTINENILKENSEETVFISDNGKLQHCIGCFGCWIKTPGQCVIKDGYDYLGLLLSKCNQLIIISQCFYGGYSPFIKNVLDRCICPYLLPYFKTKRGNTTHPKRYKNNITLSVHFYGNISEIEKDTAQKLIKTIFENQAVYFYNSFEEIKRV
jgi:multimeric flavodoxin WrbA